MPPSPALIARDRRLLAGDAAGAALLAIAEEVEPAVVRRVLRAAGISPGAMRRPNAAAEPSAAAKSMPSAAILRRLLEPLKSPFERSAIRPLAPHLR